MAIKLLISAFVLEFKKYMEGFMEEDNFRNIVLLKDLPSNIIEEAIVILKDTSKVTVKNIKQNKNSDKKDSKYIIKEAEMIISNYINKLEEKKDKNRVNLKNYKRLKMISYLLGATTVLSFVLTFLL